jgi:chemotaxis protein CheX
MTLILATILDTAAAAPLRQALKQAVAASSGDGTPLILDGSGVERAGLACLQVLAAGRSAAVQGGVDLRIDPVSPALVGMATLAGLDALILA